MIKKFLLLTLMLSSIFLLCACSSRNTNDQRLDNNFWSSNAELRIGLDTLISAKSDSSSTNKKVISDDMRDYQKELVKDLKVKLTKYFLDNYDVNISDKLDSQQIKFYQDTQTEAASRTWSGGYFIPEESNTIYLSDFLLHDKRSQFESIYIYETMYTIGIHSNKNLFAIDNGFADNEAEDFCKYEKISYSSSSNNFFAKKLARQMKDANPDLVKNYISDSNFSIEKEINKKLANIKMPFIKLSDPGNRLESYIIAFLSPESYKQNNYSLWLSFQSQEIVANYCKQFKLNNSQINSIRKNYVFENYEKVQVYNDNGEYKLK